MAKLGAVCPVVTDADERGEASRDWWPLGMIWALDDQVASLAAAVARPTTVEQVRDLLVVCHDARIPVTPAAGRSGVCGASVPVHGGVLLDLCGLTGIVDLDDVSLVADVRAGTFGDVLEEELRAAHLTVGHWPQSVALSTVGGWLACRGAGQYSTRYGKIEDIVEGLDVVLADGTMVHTGDVPRAAAGPDLTQLFVGSEGTLGVITGARLRVHPTPPAERRAAYGFSSFEAGLDACRAILRRGATPAVLRLYDDTEGARSFATPAGVHPLVVLDEGDPTLVDATMAVVGDACRAADPLDEGLVAQWLEHRNDVSALEALIQRGYVVDTLEIAARWRELPAIYGAATAALRALDPTLTASAHQSHAYGDGACLYFTFAGQPAPADREAYYRDAWDAATQAVLAHGGALSHHHGVGLNRARFVRDALGAGADVLATLKGALDPHGILNPGKLGLPSPFGPSPAWP